MLTPLSVLLPLISDKFKKVSKFIIAILILTLSIELIQFIINIGSFDIDDFILNVSGAVLAFVLLTKTKLMNFFNSIFLNINIKNKYGRYCLNTFYFLLLIGRFSSISPSTKIISFSNPSSSSNEKIKASIIFSSLANEVFKNSFEKFTLISSSSKSRDNIFVFSGIKAEKPFKI